VDGTGVGCVGGTGVGVGGTGVGVGGIAVATGGDWKASSDAVTVPGANTAATTSATPNQGNHLVALPVRHSRLVIKAPKGRRIECNNIKMT